MAMSIVQSSQFKRALCPHYVKLWKISRLWMNGWGINGYKWGFRSLSAAAYQPSLLTPPRRHFRVKKVCL